MTTSARAMARRKTFGAGLQFVADRGVIQHADAQFLQPLAEPLGVGVEQFARW